MDSGCTSSYSRTRRRAWGRLRALVCLAVFLLVGAGLALHAGWGTLSSLGIDAIASICPLGALETLVAARTIIPRALVALALVAALVLLFGRAFCAWMCPVPPLERFFHPQKKGAERTATKEHDAGETRHASERTHKANVSYAGAVHAQVAPGSMCATKGCTACSSAAGLAPVGGVRDGFRFDSRHAVLIGALASSAVFGFPVFCLVCPVGLVFATGIAIWTAFAEQTPTWSLLVFPLILLLEIVLFRKWCHKLCPLGALMSLLARRAPLLKPRVSEDACLRAKGVDCRACVEVCPEQLDPHSLHIPECTKCGLCAERCPEQAINLKLLPR